MIGAQLGQGIAMWYALRANPHTAVLQRLLSTLTVAESEWLNEI